MKAVYGLASQVMSGVFVACLALALAGYTYGDPGGDGPDAGSVCTYCAYAWTFNPSNCGSCGASSESSACYPDSFCASHNDTCEDGCTCERSGTSFGCTGR
jgi:hypothetical protein